MVPPEGEAAMLIQKYGLGKIVGPDDVEGIKKSLYNMIETKFNLFTENELKIFSRKYQTGQLAKILEKI